MKKEFDFGNIGKKVPYKVPEGFFEKLQADISAEIAGGGVVQAGPAEVRTGLTEVQAESAEVLAGPAEVQTESPVERISPERGSRPARRKVRLIIGAVAAAAAIAIFAFIGVRLGWTFSEVDDAFAALDASDRAFLLEVYDSDMFIKEFAE